VVWKEHREEGSMDRIRVLLLGITTLGLAVSACGPGDTPASGPAMKLPEDVEATVKEALSAQTGVPVEEIEVVAVQEQEWPDACLGLAEEGEVCAQVITPGWKIKLRAEGETYTLHTDEEANAIRMEE
jgi:hypothetical protein